MSTSRSSSAHSDAGSTKSSRALSGAEDDERPDRQPAAAGGPRPQQWPDAVRVQTPYVYMICGALLAMVVTGFVGSLVTLIALPGCLRGQEDVSPCAPQSAMPRSTKHQPTKPPQTPVTPPTPSAPAVYAAPSAANPSTPVEPVAPSATTVPVAPVVPVVPGLVDPPVKVFTQGKLFYRSAYVDESRGHLFVGAKEKLFKLPLDDITSPDLKLGKDVDCRNHIRVVQPIRDGSTLYICGTNSRAPTDWQIQAADLTLVPAANQVPMVGTNESEKAEGRCPYYVYQSSESLWLDDAPSNGSSSVVALTTLSTGVHGLFRYGVSNPRGLRLRSDDSRAVQKPVLVGAFSTAEHAYFVFREEGVERKACGSRNLSTVARVCKNEIGDSAQNAEPWTSLMKVRLRCIDNASANFSFDEIHASYWVPDLDNGVLFGAFVSIARTWDGVAHYDSAVCAFSLQDIERELANSTFYELTQGGMYTLSHPLPLSQVLSPRPGVTCPPGPRTISTADTVFWVTHPLVTQTPKQRHKRLFYAHSGVAFRSLVAFVLNETSTSPIYAMMHESHYQNLSQQNVIPQNLHTHGHHAYQEQQPKLEAEHQIYRSIAIPQQGSKHELSKWTRSHRSKIGEQWERARSLNRSGIDQRFSRFWSNPHNTIDHRSHHAADNVAHYYDKDHYHDNTRYYDDVYYYNQRDNLFKLSLDDISGQPLQVLHLPAPQESIQNCTAFGGGKLGKDVDCRNHIREVLPIRDGSMLYVCGTNSRSPTDWQVRASDLTLVPAEERVFITGSNETWKGGRTLLVFRLRQQSVAVARFVNTMFLDRVRSIADDAPLSGVSSVVAMWRLRNGRSAIYRSAVPNVDPNKPVYSFLLTDPADTAKFNVPNAVDALSTASHAYFVYREDAAERQACGVRVASALGRVCKVGR
ncbi:hypothetical protein HPB51_008267 [Rhipicephalus microplus]|uniref:Sema domain-containing protein n=1 Tax=Rhipicephalus microplus TaxID=6941 RepID=A0A9J6EYZ9_RHIMP|nr:hypothetical protein HPB51_008267 [Rhipicephalus microplus]